MKRSVLILVLLISIALSGCAAGTSAQSDGGQSESASISASPPPTIPDLTGTWVEATPSSSPSSSANTMTQIATITGNTIQINWVQSDNTRALYWAGSFTPPTQPGDSYAWDSENDTAQTESALLASSDATKHFTYANGVLSYDVTALGITKTVQMKKQ